MGNSYSSKINNRNKASKASLLKPDKISTDFIPYLTKLKLEKFKYCKKSKLSKSGRVYESEKYDFYENLGTKITEGISQNKTKEIKFEDFHTSNSNPMEMQNYGMVNMTITMEDWNDLTRNAKSPFYDKKFEPDIQSVIGKNKDVDKDSELSLCLKYPPLTFDRPFMYSYKKMKTLKNWENLKKSGSNKKEKITFFSSGKYSCTDIYQGVLPNSNFFSPLISLSKSSKNIEGSIFHDIKDLRGIFGFLFNTKGKWAIETVDDHICFFKRTMALEDTKEKNSQKKFSKKNRLDFLSGRAETKILWPLLMEKAYAKINGGYFNIARSNDAAMVMTDLTGCPSETKEILDYQSVQRLYTEISQGLQAGFIYCALSIDNETATHIYNPEFTEFRRDISKRKYDNYPYVVKKDDFMVEYLGMFPNQVYPILSAKGDNEQYFISMDPRGKLKFKEKKNIISGYCNHENNLLKEKNRFFKISLQDFSKIFSKIYVCYYNKNCMTTTLSSDFQPNTFSCFSLKFDTPGDYSIRVSQDSHLKKSLSKIVNYPAIQILLLRVSDENEFEYIEGKIEKFRDVWMNVRNIETNCHYNLFVKINSEKIENLGICITGFGNVIGEKLMHFPSELPSASDFSFQIAQGLSFKFWVEENEEFKPVSYEGYQKDLVYMLISDSSDGFGIVLFRNRSFRTKFKVYVPRLNYVYPMTLRDQNQKRMRISVGCGEDEIIVWDCSKSGEMKFGVDIAETDPD